MTMLNRRNALVGWGALKIAEHVLRRKSSRDSRKRKVAGAAVAVAAAATVAGLFLWQRRQEDDHADGVDLE